jgi:hypothetical protein
MPGGFCHEPLFGLPGIFTGLSYLPRNYQGPVTKNNLRILPGFTDVSALYQTDEK